MRDFVNEHIEAIILVVLVLLLVVMICFVGNILYERNQFASWYNALTPEERAEYDKPYTNTYEIFAVSKYQVTKTNRYGGVRDTYMCYEFYFVDENGTTMVVRNFRDNWGSCDVVVGESNTYVTNSLTGQKTLTITKDTVAQLSDVAIAK